MIVHVYSAFNLLWFLCNSAIINALQFALYIFVRPFDHGFFRRVMSSAQSLWVDATSALFPETKLIVTYV